MPALRARSLGLASPSLSASRIWTRSGWDRALASLGSTRGLRLSFAVIAPPRSSLRPSLLHYLRRFHPCTLRLKAGSGLCLLFLRIGEFALSETNMSNRLG